MGMGVGASSLDAWREYQPQKILTAFEMLNDVAAETLAHGITRSRNALMRPHAHVLTRPYALMNPCDHAHKRMCSFTHAPTRPCDHAPMRPCDRAITQCTRALVDDHPPTLASAGKQCNQRLTGLFLKKLFF